MHREEIIKESYKKNCYGLVVRHATREAIKDVKQSIYQLLTPEGKAMAYAFGTKLSANKPIRIYHSFIERCKQTADCIAEGFQGEVISINIADSLTGFYVYNPESVLGSVNDIGSFKFLSDWFQNFYSKKDIMPALEARQQMLNFFIDTFNPDYLNIYITHDWNIAVLYSLHYNVINEVYKWPGYMHGVSLEHNNLKHSIYIEAEAPIEINC